MNAYKAWAGACGEGCAAPLALQLPCDGPGGDPVGESSVYALRNRCADVARAVGQR